ncbi:hypothetical protein [Dokdonia sp.]|uniref:hypothetical protein n=1 Tax=Dokdonia sp. TaxID=2024995 RepID=UPI003266D284
MRFLILICTLISFLFINSLHGQESNFNKLDELTSLKSKDTLWVDIKKGGCFHGTWSKIIITRRNDQFEFIKLDDLTKILIKYDKTLILRDDTNNWIRKNLDKIKKSDHSTILSQEEYLTTIDKLKESIQFYENCSTDIAGEYSIVELELTKLKLKYSYKCKIQLNL